MTWPALCLAHCSVSSGHSKACIQGLSSADCMSSTSAADVQTERGSVTPVRRAYLHNQGQACKSCAMCAEEECESDTNA